MFDPEQLALDVLEYLIDRYPLQPKKLKWSTKVRTPMIHWVPLPPDTYGMVAWEHRGLVIRLNSRIWWTEQQLIDTVAHEYRHMMQCPRLYRYYQKSYGYWEHPLEIDARNFAAKIVAQLRHSTPDLEPAAHHRDTNRDVAPGPNNTLDNLLGLL